jgi:8-oxo-dGTP diphosphatase
MVKYASCVLIVNKNNKQFLSVSLKTDHTDFNLPGGTVEKEETIKEAGIREVKEETGIDVKNLIELHKDTYDDYEVTTFYTHDYDGEINTKENHVVKWLPIFDLTKSKTWPEYNSIVYGKYLQLCK